MKKTIILLISILVIVGIGITIWYFNKKEESKLSITFNDNPVEIFTSKTIKDLVTVNNGELLNGDDVIDTSNIGVIKIPVNAKNEKEELNKDYDLSIVDTTPPEVTGVKDLSITAGSKLDFYKNLKITDNSNKDVTKEISGTYDLSKEGTYNLSYVIKDESLNETIKDFVLTVKKSNKKTTVNKKSDYYIKVNKTMNVVMVYSKDDNGEFTNLVKTFVASAGENTPVGTFTTSDKYEKLSLVGGVYGHYTVRIYKAIWFHSVPYFSKPDKDGHWNDLEYEEYNKLGNLASKGCIRLAVRDSKWIYNNISKGTTVEIYESNTLPDGVIKPTPIKIDVNDELRRGWDPTDTDPASPWNN